ncbi:UNVERIFIED_CONTAM: hypothetical protein HDU68_006459 [Siphonaria sp. JEL0065]|nr:hypothetical protein HDU68_006459 [Siphonaria sp. JEL0065]
MALNISENDITSIGVEALGTALKDSKSRLEELNMHGLNCGPEGFQEFFAVLANPESSLGWLDVSGCNLGDSMALNLLKIVVENNVEINLTENNLIGSPEFSSFIASSIEDGRRTGFFHAHDVLSLDFLTNVASSIARVNAKQDRQANSADKEESTTMPKFKGLTFQSAYFGNQGAEAVLSCIPAWDQQIHLTMADNAITEVGLEKLLVAELELRNVTAKCQKEDCSLKIYLDGNQVSNNWALENQKRIEDTKAFVLMYTITEENSGDMENALYTFPDEDEETEEDGEEKDGKDVKESCVEGMDEE